MQNKSAVYSVCVLAAGSLWGFTGVFVRYLSAAGLSSFQMLICRALTTVILLLVFEAITDRKKLIVKLRHLPLFATMGLCSVTAFNYCYFNAILKLESMAAAAVLLYTSPAFVMFLSAIFFKEKITTKKIIAIICTFAGCALTAGISSTSASFTPTGVLLGIGAGLTYAMYSIFGKFALRNYHPMTITLYMWVFGLIFSLPFTDLSGLASHMITQPKDIFFSAAFGLISAVLPYALYSTGLKYIPASKAGVLAAAEPCVAAVTGVIMFNEPMSVMLAAGILLVLVSVFLLREKKQTAS